MNNHKRIIIPFDLDQDIYNSSYVSKNFHNYCEIFRQIFDFITPNFSVFMQKIDQLPSFDKLILIEQNIDSGQLFLFQEKIKAMALNIYFTCHSFKLFSNSEFEYILESVYSDSFVLYYVNDF